jgi:hypothetical protein
MSGAIAVHAAVKTRVVPVGMAKTAAAKAVKPPDDSGVVGVSEGITIGVAIAEWIGVCRIGLAGVIACHGRQLHDIASRRHALHIADVIDIGRGGGGWRRRLGRNAGRMPGQIAVTGVRDRVLLANGLILLEGGFGFSFPGITITAGSRGEAATQAATVRPVPKLADLRVSLIAVSPSSISMGAPHRTMSVLGSAEDQSKGCFRKNSNTGSIASGKPWLEGGVAGLSGRFGCFVWD